MSAPVASFNQAAAHAAIIRDPEAEFLAALVAERKSPRTVKNYKYDFERFRAWLGRPIETADHVALTAYFATLSDLSAATVARKQSSLSSFYSWALLMEVIEKDPMAVVRRVKVPQCLPKVLSDDKIKRFFSRLPDGTSRDRILFTLLYESGLRIEEALSIQREDIDLSTGHEQVIVMGKGAKERAVPLYACPESKNLLGECLRLDGRHGPLFVGQNGQKLSYSQAYRLFKDYAARARLPHKSVIHWFRHAFATNLLNDGVNLAVAQNLLGHADIKTTRRYLHVSDELVRTELLKRKNRLA
jgi:site-specific recombinase XerD